MNKQSFPPIQVNCVKCNNALGEKVFIRGLPLFHIGGIAAREMHGWCVQCGTPFHWNTSDKLIQKIIKELPDREEK